MPIVYNDPEPNYGPSGTEAFFTALMQGFGQAMERGIDRGYERGRESARFQREQQAADAALGREKELAKYGRELTEDDRKFVRDLQTKEQTLNEQRVQIDKDRAELAKTANDKQFGFAERELNMKEARWLAEKQDLINRQEDWKAEGPLREATRKLEQKKAELQSEALDRTGKSRITRDILSLKYEIDDLNSKAAGRSVMGKLRKLEADNPGLKDYQLQVLTEGRVPGPYDPQGINAVMDQYNSYKEQLPMEEQALLDEEFNRFLRNKASAAELEAYQRTQQQAVNERALWARQAQEIATGKRSAGFTPYTVPGLDDINAFYEQKFNELAKDASDMTREQFDARRKELNDGMMKAIQQRMSTTVTNPNRGPGTGIGPTTPFGQQFQPYGQPLTPRVSDQQAQSALEYLRNF